MLLIHDIFNFPHQLPILLRRQRHVALHLLTADQKRRIVHRQRFSELKFVLMLVFPRNNRPFRLTRKRIQLRLIRIRLSQQLFINNFALKIHISIRFLQFITHLKVIQFLRQHLLHLQKIVTEERLLLVRLNQLKHKTYLRRKGNSQPLITKMGRSIPQDRL